MRRTLSRRRQVGGAIDLSLYLRRVGPFENDDLTLVSSLSDITYSASGSVASNSRSSPLKYKNVTINAGVNLTPAAGQGAIFFHCDVFTNNGSVFADGADADGTIDGADGGGSGGGGGASQGEDFRQGGDGGSGAAGLDGEAGGEYSAEGIGGDGWGTNYNAGSPFTYPNGGAGTTALSFGNPMAASAGGYGAGFGGGGAGTDCEGAGQQTWGGPAGGGMLIVVCREFLGTGTLSAEGGDASGDGGGLFGVLTGAGGGGVIVVWAQKKSTTPTVSVQGGFWYDFPPEVFADSGTSVLYEIEADHVSTTSHTTNWSDTWDNT